MGGRGRSNFRRVKGKEVLSPSPYPPPSIGSFNSEALSLVIEPEWEASMMELGKESRWLADNKVSINGEIHGPPNFSPFRPINRDSRRKGVIPVREIIFRTYCAHETIRGPRSLQIVKCDPKFFQRKNCCCFRQFQFEYSPLFPLSSLVFARCE